MTDLIWNDAAFLVAAIQFEITTQNRYKLSKQYRKLLIKYGVEPKDQTAKDQILKAKVGNSIKFFAQILYMQTIHSQFRKKCVYIRTCPQYVYFMVLIAMY